MPSYLCLCFWNKEKHKAGSLNSGSLSCVTWAETGCLGSAPPGATAAQVCSPGAGVAPCYGALESSWSPGVIGCRLLSNMANKGHPDDITSVPNGCRDSPLLGNFALLAARYLVPPSPSPAPTSEYLGCLWQAHFQNTWTAPFPQRERAVQPDVNFSLNFHILLMIRLTFSSLHSCCIHIFPLAY